MVFLIFLFGILLAMGLFFIMADLLRLPRLATQRAMLSVGRQEKKQARSVEALLMGWAVRLAPHIHMDEYKRGRLKNTLAAAGLNMTPEEYTAFAMVKTGAVLLAVIPCLLIFPLLALVVVLLAVAVYFKEIRRAEEMMLAAMFTVPAFAAGTGDVAGAIEGTWTDASDQIKTVVNNVVFPVIDLILAVFFFAKLGMAYFDYRKHGQFEWTAPAILFACLIFTLTAPTYVWSILGM